MFLVIALLSLFFSPVFAQNSLPDTINRSGSTGALPRIETTYKLDKRTQSRMDWVREAIWIWTPSYEYNLIATPTLRIVFETDFDFSISNLDVDVKLVNEEIEKKGNVLVKRTMIDVPFYYKKTTVEIRNREGKSGQIIFVLAPSKGENIVLIHDGCLRRGIHFERIFLKAESEPSNLALTCSVDRQSLTINIQHQVGWQTSVRDKVERLRIGKFRGILQIDLEGMELPQDGSLGTFTVIDKNQALSEEYRILTDGEIFPRWQFRWGGAVQSLHYNESETATRFDSALFKIFLLGKYDFQASPYLIGGEASLSPVSIYSSQGVDRRAVFTEMEGWFAKKFARENRSWLSIGMGMFFWGMQVQGSGWGVDHFSGPRLLIVYQKDNPNQREYEISIKASLVHQPSGINMESSLLEVEGAYEITTPRTERPIFLYGQLQKIEVDSSEVQRTIQATSVSLGFAAAF